MFSPLTRWYCLLKNHNKGKVIVMSDQAEKNEQEVFRQYQVAREQFRMCITAIMDPIESRLSEFPENAFSELFTDNVALDEARKYAEEAQIALQRISRLVTEAAYDGIEVETTAPLQELLEQTKLKLALAWTLNHPELYDAIDKAQAWRKSHEPDGVFQELLQQANIRLGAVSSAAAVVGSIEQRTEALQEFMALLNEMDNAPINDLREIKKSFDDILMMNQQLQKYQVTEIRDERDVQSGYRRLPELTKQREDIREIVRNVIRGFLDKINRFIVHGPKVAADWFEPIKLFQDYLHVENDALQLGEIEDTRRKIEENCNKWELAEEKLLEAVSLLDTNQLDTTDTKKSLWYVCDLVKAAEEIYPEHTRIDEKAASCISKIEAVMATDISKWHKWCLENLANQERTLVSETDWKGLWLQTTDLPAWLVEEQHNMAMWQQHVECFKQNLEIHLGSAAVKRHVHTIEEASSRLEDAIQPKLAWQNELVKKRSSIRSFIDRIQDLIRKGSKGSKEEKASLYQKAEDLYQNYIQQHSDWREDVELSKVNDLLLAYQGKSQIIKKACLAYKSGQWSECISTCKSYFQGQPNPSVMVLDDHIATAYLATRLQSGVEETLSDVEIEETAQILLQLATVMRAAQEIERCYPQALFAQIGHFLQEIETYGQGECPIVYERKGNIKAGDQNEIIKFDIIQQEYRDRLEYGNTHYQQGSTINHLAKILLEEGRKLLASPSSESTWLVKVQNNLNSLKALDTEKASLWVGDIHNQLKALSFQFLGQLAAYLSKLTVTIDQCAAEEVEQAFNFLQTARHFQLYEQLRLADRRTVIYHYYLNLEQRFSGQFQSIAKNWRRAVEEFPDHDDILQKFRSVIREWWLHELDQVLLKAVQDEEQFTTLGHLFDQNSELYPDLFGDVQTLAGYAVKTRLDAYAEEIKVRRASMAIMQEANQNLAIRVDNLPLVLNDLRDASNKLKRPELDEKIKALASDFTEDEVKKAKDYEYHDQRIKAVEHYLRAFSLASWEKSGFWLERPETKTDVLAYWEKLSNDIDDFHELEGDIFLRHANARQLMVCLEELRACTQSRSTKSITWIPQPQINKAFDVLSKKIELLEWGVDTIYQFSPSGNLWKAAVTPALLRKIASNETASFNSVISSWNQLERYLKGLKSRFGNDHFQVAELDIWLERFKEAVNALYIGVGTLREDLRTTEDYDACLEICRKINDSTLLLIDWEPQYYELWQSWFSIDLNGEITYYYPTLASVYESLKFTHGEISLPYFLEADAFNAWHRDLITYVMSDLRIETTYSFDEDRFTLYQANHPELQQVLRSELEQGVIFLGRFLVLAYMDKSFWNKESKSFDQKLKASRELKEFLVNDNYNKLNALRTSEFCDMLESWISYLNDLVKKGMPISESSQNAKVKVAQAVLIGSNNVEDGELKKMKETLRQRVDYLDIIEINAVNKFFDDLNNVNRTKLTGEALDNVTTLKGFYAYSPLEPAVLELFKKMDVAAEKMMEIDSQFNTNFKSLHEFFDYCEGVVQKEVL